MTPKIPHMSGETIVPLGSKYADDFLATEEMEEDDPETYPMVPWCDSTDDDFGTRWVDYVDRGPNDVVLSGPVIGGWGPGRWHKNRRIAYWRLVDKFGADRVKQLRQSQGRWSFLIKNLRLAGDTGQS